VEAWRGKGVFVASAPPARPSPHLREGFLHETVIRAAALGMTADDLAVAVLSVPGVRPAAVQGTVGVLLVECNPPELDFFAKQLEALFPVRVDKVLLGELPAVTRRQPQSRSLADGEVFRDHAFSSLERDPYRDDGGES
jgi:hypothetical protein